MGLLESLTRVLCVEAVKAGNVEPEGEPLQPWDGDEDVPIPVEDVDKAVHAWNVNPELPPNAIGILSARQATEEEIADARASGVKKWVTIDSEPIFIGGIDK